MNKLVKAIVISSLFFTSSLYSQSIVVDPVGAGPSTDNLEELIESVLISGGCATVNNFRSYGKDGPYKSYGYFTNSNPDFPFKEGIILSTGDASTAIGPNNTLAISGGGDDVSWVGDNDIKIILDSRFKDNKDTQNATYVQFDFIPKNERVSFNYIFASEEWESGGYECPESGNTVQDGFAFLIEGPGISPDDEFIGQVNEWKNIALIPDTDIPVSIGTIYNNSDCVPSSVYAEYYKTNSPLGSDAATTSAIQFNAQTTVLNVKMTVIPGQVYTLKLVIADRDDTLYDSAVFLEAGSFNLGVDVGENMTIAAGNAVCSGGVQELKSNQDISLGAFQWKKWNGTVFEDITGETGVDYTVTSEGTYKLAIEISPGCIMEGEVVVEFAKKPIAPAIVANLLVCDIDNDGVFSFNLSAKDAEILDGQSTTDFQVRYFPTEADLEADTNVLSSTAYINTNVTETIWARIEDKVATYCYDKISFKLTLFERAFPKSAAEIPPVITCDNTSVGTLFDGFVVLDLTQRTTAILNGQNAGFSLEYYTDSLFTALSRIVDPVNFENTITGGQTIYVKMINDLTIECFATTSFEIKVEKSPVLDTVTEIHQCDDNNDGVYLFDLSSLKDVEILNVQAAATFNVKYYKTEIDANAGNNQIVGEYTNTSAVETIWYRIENRDKTDCFVVSSFGVHVYPTANPKASGDISDLAYCDSATFGTDTDGKNVFDLTERASSILNGQDTGFTLTYYTGVAMASSSEVLSPTAYVNTTAGGETIYVKMSGAYVGCEGSTTFNIVVNPLPIIIDIVNLKQCDNDSDGISDFNLHEADAKISANYENEIFTYYKAKSDAEQAVNPITNATVYTSGISKVWARIVTDNGCYRIAEVELIVSTTLIPSSFLEEFKTCDDAVDGDNTNGVSVFDFSSVEATILAGGFFPAGQQPVISYYKNEADALAEENKIEDTSNYRNVGYPNEQFIYVRVDSGLNNDCIGFGPHIKLIVEKVPEVTLDATGIICANDLPKSIAVKNSDPLLTYNWKDADGLSLGSGVSIEIVKGGKYTVVAVNAIGCESSPKTIDMIESEKAVLTNSAIKVTDDIRNNSINIDVLSLGDGDYEYVLNEIDGDYQDEPYFSNVIPGFHMLYVRDKNGCGISMLEVSVLGFPKFFTPNNDGFNDYWNIKGLSKDRYSKASVAVFDRFGKLLKTFDDGDIGWDGSFNGYRVPSSDYWYVITLIDLNGEARIIKGNFSLIRRKNE